MAVAFTIACGGSNQDASASSPGAPGTSDASIPVGDQDAGSPGVGEPSDAAPREAAPSDASPPVQPAEGGAPPVAACSQAPVWSPGDAKTISLSFGSEGTRSYDVYVGKGVKVGTAAPLVVNVHGLTNSPALQAQFSQMNPVADAEGFVVVYPAGLNASFNAGSCCGQSAASGVDDVGFIRAVVADAEAKICIDAKRVYETGFSNGGMMAYELACHAADLFAAVAPTEGDNQTIPPCSPSRPVPLAAFQYLADPVVLAASAQQSVQAWAQQDGCTDPSPTTSTVSGFSCDAWSKCSGGASVWYCTMPGGTHYPPVGSAPVIWSFLSQFTL
jgi:polyhydroxybutyrate depolymerase